MCTSFSAASVWMDSLPVVLTLVVVVVLLGIGMRPGFALATTSDRLQQMLEDGAGASSSSSSPCRMSEFACANGTCISASKFCDGRTDCIDGSDERSSCNGNVFFFNVL